MEEKRNYYLQKQAADEEKLQKIQEKQNAILEQKQRQDLIKQSAKQDAAEQIKQTQDFNKAQTLEKIKADNERLANIKKEKEILYESRRKMKKEMDLNKQKMMEQFEKMKTGKLDPSVVAKEFRGNTESKSQELNNDEQIKEPSVKEKKLEKKNLPKSLPIKKEIKQKKSQEETERIFEDLKITLNEEMMRVLEEEKEKEAKREIEAEDIENETQRDEIDRLHGLDRAKAQKKIQDLAEFEIFKSINFKFLNILNIFILF